jgi:sterol desaturase/sphingolipid hydroxylase (fatty acid hydroxylase superfamily)/uncharacterized membrane protein YhhN
MSKVIVFATPVFLLMIALEYWWGLARARKGTGRNTYTLSDTINSINLGILSQLSGALSKLLTIGIYTLVFGAVAVYPDVTFWKTWYGALLALIFYDLCYYWLHRAGHEISLFWAAHVVHHQSQQYNLSTALRQTSSGVFFSWIFYLPMAIAGVPPEIFAIVALVDLLYQFWVHTEQVGKLGWFDRVFCSPSNHRVHHAVNTQYLDKNYGGILVLWDRLFGSFAVEEEKCVYGTRGQLNSWDPLWANLEVYAALAKESWHARSWADKVLVWFKPPGWQSAAMAQDQPKLAFRLESVTKFNPPLSRAGQWFAGAQFLLTLGAVAALLWHVDAMPLGEAAIWCAALATGVWALGRFTQGSLHLLEVLAVQAAALAVLGSLGFLPGYGILKPLVMAVAIIFIATKANSTWAPGRFGTYLLLALAFSMGGDIALLWPDTLFILGLGLFLVAHIFYIALFRQGQAWFPSRKALLCVLAVGAGMYAIIWPGLADPVLKVAVATYVTVISLMAAQAIGRATVLGDAASRWVALGACIFMVSDAFIAINKFLVPVPLASLWILATYYAAQLLIVHHARPPHSAESRRD